MLKCLQLYRIYALLQEKAKELSSNKFDDKEFEEEITIKENEDKEVQTSPRYEKEEKEAIEEIKAKTKEEMLEEQNNLELILFDKILPKTG